MGDVLTVLLGRVNTKITSLEMELTDTQFGTISSYFPIKRGNVRLSDHKVLNAILYVAGQGCKWRALPQRFGN